MGTDLRTLVMSSRMLRYLCRLLVTMVRTNDKTPERQCEQGPRLGERVPLVPALMSGRMGEWMAVYP